MVVRKEIYLAVVVAENWYSWFVAAARLRDKLSADS